MIITLIIIIVSNDHAGTSLKYLNYLKVVNGPSFTITKVDNYIKYNCLCDLQFLVLYHTRITPQAIINIIG